MSGTLRILRLGITQTEADCVVNAANARLLRGGGVCGVLFAQAGAERLQRACDAIGGCPTGGAVRTPAFDLRAKYIVHAVGPVWAGGHRGEKALLRSAYREALERAMEAGCHLVAFPLISAGIYGFPAREAWEAALCTILEVQRTRPACPDVIMAIPDRQLWELGCRMLKEKQE